MIRPPPQFTATPESIAADSLRLVEQSRQLKDELVRNVQPYAADFTNVMLPLASLENEFVLQANILAFYRHVSADPQIRDASLKAQILFDTFLTESLMRKDVFTLVKAVRKKNESLDQESALYLKRIYNKHIQTGVGVQDTAQRSRFKAIQERLSQIRVKFQENLSLDQSSISFTLAELKGVPSGIFSLPENHGKEEVRVILSDPSHSEIMTYASTAETRKRLFIARQNRCKGNAALIKEAVILRCERARLLGFSNNAAFRFEDRMAKNPDTVNEFFADLRSKLTPGGLRLLQTLKDIKKTDLQCRGETDQDDGRFFLWDYEFYHNIMLEKQLLINREQIREYFPIQTTVVRMLSLFSQLFALEFRELESNDKTADIVWHEDVQVFSVYDDETRGGEFLGYLYLDLFHRPGKYPRSSFFSLQPGFTRQDGSRHHPATALLCDFPKPTTGKPSLLRHFDVVLMFHELGHGIHDLVSKTQYSCFHGPDGVCVDFGEMPSQMLEQWCWTPTILKYLSLHYSHLGTDEFNLWENENKGMAQAEMQMPDVLIEALVQSRRLTFGPLFYLDQLHRGIFDMTIHQVHSLEEAESVNLEVIWNKLRKEIQLIDGPEALGQHYTWGHGYATFSHLVSNDYDAGYYAYLFSQVYAADLFKSKFKNDLFNSSEGQRYRQIVLEKGGGQEEMQSLVDFLGRKPSAKAFNEILLGLALD